MGPNELAVDPAQVQPDRRQHWLLRLQAWRALSIDVETAPADGNRIFKLGAVRSQDQRGLTLSTSNLSAGDAPRKVDEFAAGSKLLVGHNLRRHDLPELTKQYPALRCTQLPVLDTLELSTIAFPNNPYHRLVKGYKLVSDSKNEPERDARITLDLLVDELAALDAMWRSDADWVVLLHFLLRTDGPLSDLLAEVRGASSPAASEAGAIAVRKFDTKCCQTGLRAAVESFADSSEAAAQDSVALAYALGWIRVSGGNSVLPLWVNETLPAVRKHIEVLRERDCADPTCEYCRTQHNPEGLLSAYFGKPGFREKPAAPDGTSLQRAIVQAGLKRQSLLAVLPTGGGKSICYQLPALVHYARSGKLTVIVSPLQSLMKDQVDNLVAAGVQCAVTINGLLTPLERRAALDRIRLGDAGIVLVSPEQFRSRTFCDAIRYRQIATWVFDEAHCLSKWGHDFRTDYLYVARYIGEHFAAQQAPIACFTATAKLDVVEDLSNHFQDSLGITLQKFLGGHERTNLTFSVVPASKAEKAQRIVELIREGLKPDGAAIVFCATRKNAAFFAEILTKQGVTCGCFHGGLPSEKKKEVQQDFLNGTLQVIAATNAFGMGVDKPNIRLVVHADIPGSLENYLQEAGRAGRDGAPAHCILLFDEEDVETQFRLSASSQLRLKDFSGLLRAVRRRCDRMKSSEVVVSAKELLAESEGTSIELDAPDASTKVTTAIAWLERSGFLQRNENRTRVFPASLKVATLEEALRKIGGANLAADALQKYTAVVQALFRSDSPDGLSTDELMLDSGIAPEDCFRILYELEKLGVLVNDLGLTVRVARSGKGASQQTLQDVEGLEVQLLDIMCEEAPDADAGQGPQVLSIRPICTELRKRLPQRSKQITGEALRACIRSLSESFGSGAEKRSMLDSRPLGLDSLAITVHRPWRQIRDICKRRRSVSQVVLSHLLGQIPAESREASHRIECKARDLLQAVETDLELKGQLREPATALEHALLYMHENKVLELDKGRSVFRSAMTISMEKASGKSRFLKDDYAPLQDFYQERTNQTHFMHEYAKLGMKQSSEAAEFVAAYFSMPRPQFARKYFRGRSDLLRLSTTDESYKRIVSDLRHPVQQELVEAPETGNHLVLAGPGSGKTKVIVHRIAYLIRVKRVAPERIIALAFNRGAALSLKRRLLALVGQDARGVMVLTYHAMALRLTGTSLAAADRADRVVDFEQVLKDAVDLLEGKSDAFLDADDARDRLLQQYEYIFVDEYQDITELGYSLVSALAGRGRQGDDDSKLSIMAVGDDDQNIYSFNGAKIEFIRRFQDDYPSQITYLVENFRSTQHIISASNHLIQRAAERMKVNHPIRINAARQQELAGGPWQARDPETQGQVRLVTAPGHPNLQAQLVFAELSRIKALDPQLPWGEVAVLARTHDSLQPLRALLAGADIQYELARRDSVRGQLPLMRSREGWAARAWLSDRQGGLVRMADFREWVHAASLNEPSNPYWADLTLVVEELGGELEDLELPPATVLDVLYEASEDSAQHGDSAAVKLLSAHSAKGLEFSHVIVMDCGDWRTSDDERRLLYVAMTRAKYSLTVFRVADGRNTLLSDLSTVEGVASLLPSFQPKHRADIQLRYLTFGPKEVDIGFAGRLPAHHPVHRELRSLAVGSELLVQQRHLMTKAGVVVGRLAAATQQVPGSDVIGVVRGFMVRTRAQSAPQYLESIQSDQWEVPLVEFVTSQTPQS